MDSSEQILLKPGQKFGQFEIVGLIGSGGMGQVYKALHTTLEEDFAIKILHPDITKDPASIYRLRMEARTAFHLKHCNVLNIEEFNEADARFYLRMPLMKGLKTDHGEAVSLSDLMAQRGRKLPEADAAVILHDILEGLAYAHENGVIHRDIKPANILFDGNRAVISDFGLVRIVGEDFFRSRIDETVAITRVAAATSQTSAGSNALLGTYNYMSPEQRLGHEANAQSDVYAAGLIALEMLTGRTSFGMKAPSRSVKGLSPQWDSFLQKALEPEAGDRFSSARQMLDAFPKIKGSATLLSGRKLEGDGTLLRRTTLLLLGALAMAAAGAGTMLFLQGGLSRFSPQDAQNSPDTLSQTITAQELETTELTPTPLIPEPSPSQAPRNAEAATQDASPPPVVDAPPAASDAAPISTAVEQTPTAPDMVENTVQDASPIVAPEEVLQIDASTPNTQETTIEEPAVEPEKIAPPPVDRTWLTIILPKNVVMKFRLIETGTFYYGSPANEIGRAATREEFPRKVSIGDEFYISRFELTQAQYEAISGTNPSRFRAPDKPVEQISYISLTRRGGFLDLFNRYLADNGYAHLKARLPSEEEWEYACRAGTTSAFNDGSTLRDASDEGNASEFAVFGKPFGQSAPVGTLTPNAWGLYDMHGNVEELTDNAVVRGGSWASTARDCRSAARRNMGTSTKGNEKTGVRLVIEMLDFAK